MEKYERAWNCAFEARKISKGLASHRDLVEDASENFCNLL
jgi:hypothetical protein